MADFFAQVLQHLLPKLWLTRCLGRLATMEAGSLTTWVIRCFARYYRVDMSEALHADPAYYKTFNTFFTRQLRPEVRPLAQADFVSPVDGTISQCGDIEGEHIFQAKGHRYTVAALLAGDQTLAAHFIQGAFATLYLSPRDYHRIHMPCSGRLMRMIYVPGSLFSVNPATVRTVPGLFARNERVICVFESAVGPWVLILVGATIVGSMATVWHGIVNPEHPQQIQQWRYENSEIHLQQGQEMGRFLLGSTVIMLTPRNTVHLLGYWRSGQTVKMGEAMGSFAL